MSEWLWIGIAAAVVALASLVLRIVTKKRAFTPILIILLLVVVGAALLPLAMPQAESALADGEVCTVVRGDLAEVVEASGNLAPRAQVNVTFDIGGTLEEIRVKTGDQVVEGQVLAVLETADLELQLAQAQAAVGVAKANLDKVLAGARAEDVTTTENSLSQAYANLTQQQVALSAATERARLSWVAAANNLRDAQQSYENIYWDNRELEEKIGAENVPDARYDNEATARRAVENAEAAMEQARLSYEAAKQQEESSVRTAQLQVSTAQASLEKLTDGPLSTDVAAAQASVEQARASLAITQAQLDKAALRAPFSGVVGKVLATVDTPVSAATPIVVLFDPAAYQIDVEVDEVDISSVQLGQEVHVSLDALPEITLTARVADIALTPTTGQGVVTYQVRVILSAISDDAVRAGMTANVKVITRQAENVLVVPRRAVRPAEGRMYVERVLPGDVLESVEVALGLAGPQYVEIVAGVQEGDLLLVRGIVQSSSQSMFVPGSGAGGGLGAGALLRP